MAPHPEHDQFLDEAAAETQRLEAAMFVDLAAVHFSCESTDQLIHSPKHPHSAARGVTLLVLSERFPEAPVPDLARAIGINKPHTATMTLLRGQLAAGGGGRHPMEADWAALHNLAEQAGIGSNVSAETLSEAAKSERELSEARQGHVERLVQYGVTPPASRMADSFELRETVLCFPTANYSVFPERFAAPGKVWARHRARNGKPAKISVALGRGGIHEVEATDPSVVPKKDWEILRDNPELIESWCRDLDGRYQGVLARALERTVENYQRSRSA